MFGSEYLLTCDSREGVEDLTGGVSTTIIPTDILSKDRFWNESILKVNEEFLIGCGTTNWDDPLKEGRDGIQGGHAYSVLRAVNYGKERLMLLKNPWGEQEWNGMSLAISLLVIHRSRL
jgi:hypothetical protein